MRDIRTLGASPGAAGASPAPQPGTSCPGARGLRGGPPAGLTLSQVSRDVTSCAFWQDRMDPARLSMTPSTDSSVKKVTCGGEERGCQPSGEPGGHVKPLGPSTPPSPACPPATPPTTSVSGRFHETMPTSPDSASCGCTSPGVRMRRGLCPLEGPRAAPTLGQSPPGPADPEPAWEWQDRGDNVGATSREKLLIQGTGKPGDCGCSGPGSVLHGHRWGLRACQGPALAPRTAQAEHPAPPPPLRRPAHPSLHEPARGLSRSTSPQCTSPPAPCAAPRGLHPSQSHPGGTPRDSPTMHRGSHRQRVGEQRGRAPLGPVANSAPGGCTDPSRAALRPTPPYATPDSPRSRPRTGRSGGSWWRA